MCEPTTLVALGVGAKTAAIAATAAQVASLGMGAYGMYAQGQARQEQYEYQAAVDRNNQTAAQYQAQDALDRGRVAESAQRRKTAQIMGQQEAGLASRGMDIGYGSALSLLNETATFGELDALTVRSNAEREAYGYTQQAQNFGMSASGAKRAGQNAATSGMFGAASSILAGAGKVAETWKSGNTLAKNTYFVGPTQPGRKAYS